MKEISATKVKELLSENKAEVIDVRTREEYLSGHIEGASNLPLDQIGQWILSLEEGTTYVMQCKSGGRSAKACEILESQNINCSNLVGGIEAWIEAGFEIKRKRY